MNKISQTIPLQYDTPFSPFKAEAFDTALQFLSSKGFTGVELAIAHPHLVNAEELTEKLQLFNLAATTLSTGQAYGLDGVWLASPDAPVRQKAIELIKGHIELSSKIGFPPVTIGLLRGKLEEGNKASLLENFKSAVLICAEHASKFGVTLQIEPICKEETILLNSVYETLEFIESIGNPANVGILYDTYHSYREDGDMAAAIKSATGKITNVHFSDSHRGLPGYGEINFASVIQTLRAINYSGAFALETLSIPSTEFVNDNCYTSITPLVISL